MLTDVDNDNDRDLLTGGWWEPCRIYLNNNGSYNTTPDYTSTSSSVVEAIVCGDVDKDALEEVQQEFTGDGMKNLFYMPRTPLQELKRAIVGSDTLILGEYCYDLECGWISLANPPDSGETVTVEAVVSWDLDMGITNWDQSKGNYLFYNTTNPVYANKQEVIPDGYVLYQNYPNPFNPSTKIKFTIPSNVKREMLNVVLKVYDILGNEFATLVDRELSPGEYEVEFNIETSSNLSLTSGVYFFQLKTAGFTDTKKMLLMK
jgi:hypothetical protein